jgi:anti-sigma factor RsiW
VIDAYLDGELSVAATLRAHEHFAICENCRHILESEAALHGLLVRASRAEPVPTELRSNVLGRLPTGGRARSRPARRLIVRFGIVSRFVGLAVAGWLATERLLPQAMTPLAAELASKHLLYGEGHGAASPSRCSLRAGCRSLAAGGSSVTWTAPSSTWRRYGASR